MTSQTTFENELRRRLLDLIYGQWGVLGSPFSDRGASNEIIDPEALLCCSLEFLPTEPRLAEAVIEWVRANDSYLVRQRVYKQLDRADPRAFIWHALDSKARAPRTASTTPTEACHGLASPSEVEDFIRLLEQWAKHPASPRVGRKAEGSATLLLRARDLLGQDIRHFLLVYLLAFPHGGKLRDVQSWSGHAYRSLSDAADRWEAVGVVSLESGFCRLLAPEPFQALLKIRSERLVIVNWLSVFETCVRLLRDLSKARSKGFDESSSIQQTLQREAAKKLETLSSHSVSVTDTSVARLLRTFPALAR